MKKVYLIVFLSICFWCAHSQYYYFDSWTDDYEYQQGCNESLFVRVSTQSKSAKAWRFHVVLDPQHILYSTSDLRNTLFKESTSTFVDWSSESSPSWKPWSNFSILQIDRKNNLTDYNWLSGLYGTIKFVPIYSPSNYSVVFGMEYNWEIWTSNSTIETTLSSRWGTEIINPSKQYQFMTWTYAVHQKPCIDDSKAPSISIERPINLATKQRHLSWIKFSLTDIGGSSSDVPYIWIDDQWTGNNQWIDNQYWIDIATLQITLSGNWQLYTFNSGSYAIANGKTWQFLDKNYDISIPSWALFDYWIEKKIDLSVKIKDRKWLETSINYSFNHPKSPELINDSNYPVINATFVNYDAPIIFGVQDDWAGVNSGSIVVTLSWINWTNYGPYVFSGNVLNLSGIGGSSLQPNWMVELSEHKDFPASWTIHVNVVASDMAGNQWVILDYNFVTRQNCSQLWCCDDKYIKYKNISSLFARNTITILGGINADFFTWIDGTWYIDCWLTDQGMFIYKWTEIESGSAEEVWFIDVSSLRIMWNKVKATLSWSTLFLQKIFEHWSLDWWGWWWWGNLQKDYCPDGDFSPSYYDDTCEWNIHWSAIICPVEDSSYSQELIDAFQFAYGLGVTTMCPIEKADITWNLLRKHLAKMITEYAVTIVWLYPDVTKKWCDMYDDMKNQTSETNFYSKMVCQLWLMWLESDGIDPLKSFTPNDVVTRAQFWTILSRLIFGDAYNTKEKENIVWYKKHLNALKDHNIMNKIENPYMIEMRWWVLLMLQRTYETGAINKYRMLHNANNAIRVLYDF